MNYFYTCAHCTLYSFKLNGVYSKYNFPFPHVFPQPPFPLEREPTASAPRGDTLSTRIDKYRPLVMSLVRGRKESKLVRSLVLYVKLGVRLLAAVAARNPSSNNFAKAVAQIQATALTQLFAQ